MPSIRVNFAACHFSGEGKAATAQPAAQFKSPRLLDFIGGSIAKTERAYAPLGGPGWARNGLISLYFYCTFQPARLDISRPLLTVRTPFLFVKWSKRPDVPSCSIPLSAAGQQGSLGGVKR
jgi:hypothetical protein